MKSFPTRFLTFLLAALILFTSTGFGLIEHSCAMRGKKSYSFVTKESCSGCENHHKKAPIGKASVSKSKCCDDNVVEKEKTSESIANIFGKLLKSATFFIVNSIFFIATTAFEFVFNLLSSNQNDVCSLAGRSLLNFIGLLRL